MAESIQAIEESYTELYSAISISGLLTDAELNIFLRKRRHYEELIRSHGNNIENEYLRFINYDQNMFDMLKRRKKKLTAEQLSNKRIERCKNVETIYADKIHLLHLDLLKKFPNNLHNWGLYLEFCKKMKRYHVPQRTLDQLTKIHADKPIAFAYAAEWSFQRTRNHELARAYLLKGNHLHKTNPDLYLEILKNELEFTQFMKEKYEDDNQDLDSLSDSILNGDNCRIIYDFAKKNIEVNIKNLDFYKDMLALYHKYEFTQAFQIEIIGDILKSCPGPGSELFRDLFARINLSGPTPYDIEAIRITFETYKKMLILVDTEQMWSYTLDFLVETMSETTSELNGEEIKQWYLTLVQEAHEKEKLSVDQYLNWMKFLLEDKKRDELNALQVYIQSNERLSSSPDLWVAILKDRIAQSYHKNVLNDFFKVGIQALKDKALPFYLHYISYMLTIGRALVMEAYEIGINQGQYPELCTRIRVMYLEWLALSETRDKSIRFYQQYRKTPPLSLEFHETMYQIESLQLNADKSFLRDIRATAAFTFGKNNIDVWLKYISFDFEYFNGSNTNDIYQMALKFLSESTEQLIQFQDKYVDLKSKIQVMPSDVQLDDDRSSDIQSIRSEPVSNRSFQTVSALDL